MSPLRNDGQFRLFPRRPNEIYDAAGFATSRGGVAIGWTATGRMSSFGSDWMQWDLSERLVFSSLSGNLRDFSRFGGRIERNPASGAFTVLDLGAVSINLESGARTYRHLDFRGNVKFTSNDAGIVTSHIRYSAYGVDEVFGSTTDAMQFAGGQSFGPLFLLGARVYDSEVGRFLSPDPVFQMLNQYSYTSGDPVLFWDKSGMQEAGSNLRAEAAAVIEGASAKAAALGGGLATFAAASRGYKPVYYAAAAASATMFAISGALWWVATEVRPSPAAAVPSGALPFVGFGVSASVPAISLFGTAGQGPRGDKPYGPGEGVQDATTSAGYVTCAPSTLTHLPRFGGLLWCLIGLQLVFAGMLLARRRMERSER